MRVLVLDGNENQAVAAVRSLARAGHTVIAGSDASWSKASWSRAANGSFTYPAPQRAANAFIERIVVEVRGEPGTLVMPMTERTTLPLSAHREKVFSAGGRLVLPPHETILRAFDKEQTTRLADSLGVSIPQTYLITNSSEAEQFALSARYPQVLKPRSSEEISTAGNVVATGAPSYAGNADEFLAAYRGLSERCSSVLAQEFIEGAGTGYFALMREGELRAEFAHLRIRDVRPTGSGSAVRVSCEPDAKVRADALAILRALRWHGVAMVEFRQRSDGTPVFLEVNGRFWNSLPLAVYAGVDFPALLAEMVQCGDVEIVSHYRIGVRCRWLLGDFRHLLEVWRGAPKGYSGKFPERLSAFKDFITPVAGTFHDNFSWSDPLPEVGDWLDFIFRKLPARAGKTTPKDLDYAERRYSLP